MITHIFGLPKSGKTALLTYFAICNMFGDAADSALRSCRRYVAALNAGGFRLSVPEKHLVYSDHDIALRLQGRKPRFNHYTNGFRLALGDNLPFPTDFIPPYSTILLAEAQTCWDCHVKALNPHTVRFLQFHGHFHINMFLDSQRYDGLYKDLRMLTQKYIEIIDVSLSYDRKGNPRTRWHVREFDGFAAVDGYFKRKADGNKDNYPVKTIEYDGNIFDSYDAYDRAADFLAGHYDDDFVRGRIAPAGMDVSAVSARNIERTLTAPEGYYEAQGTK